MALRRAFTVAHAFTIPAQATYDLVMSVAPAAAGTTQPAVGTHAYLENETVSISAAAADGYVFSHWSGDVADPNATDTTITMDGDEAVTAYFIPASNVLGDVNGDGMANSTDALVVLSCDVGIDNPQYCPALCGDVNVDGAANSTDALIILSFDVGLSVPYAVGEPGCPSNVAP
jgi:hypothetical protein